MQRETCSELTQFAKLLRADMKAGDSGGVRHWCANEIKDHNFILIALGCTSNYSGFPYIYTQS